MRYITESVPYKVIKTSPRTLKALIQAQDTEILFSAVGLGDDFFSISLTNSGTPDQYTPTESSLIDPIVELMAALVNTKSLLTTLRLSFPKNPAAGPFFKRVAGVFIQEHPNFEITLTDKELLHISKKKAPRVIPGKKVTINLPNVPNYQDTIPETHKVPNGAYTAARNAIKDMVQELGDQGIRPDAIGWAVSRAVQGLFAGLKGDKGDEAWIWTFYFMNDEVKVTLDPKDYARLEVPRSQG